MDKSVWREVTRQLKPDWSDERFELAWLEFLEWREAVCDWRQLKKEFQARKALRDAGNLERNRQK